AMGEPLVDGDLVARPSPGYELLDSGGGRKLERIAGVLVDRPSPQAIWRKRLGADAWSAAVATVVRTKDGGGYWTHRGAEPADLWLRWAAPHGGELALRLRFTSFGHCGAFFEQDPVWQLLNTAVAGLRAQLGQAPKTVNLFAYTGAASLAMATAGAEVFHVDSAKGVLTWGKESEAASALGEGRVRWIHDDARSFLAHSARKGFRYRLILADPPSWGHGADKETWDFDEQVQILAEECRAVLEPAGRLLLTAHTPGVQRRALANVLATAGFVDPGCGELAVAHRDDPRLLPAGIYACGTVAS
ncbi:MAG: class I SAM-dependent methyltransferase, partial [Planctomycetes bacterium]|nr:class I SAM-dependent methyltransferase [Planctomycetota bacterium]